MKKRTQIENTESRSEAEDEDLSDLSSESEGCNVEKEG